MRVPYVEIDGIKFYSDRFYLNAPTGLPYYKHDEDRNRNNGEHYGSQSSSSSPLVPPPLFDRARLINSLDLKAAVFGTYTIDIDWISNEMPSIFSPPLDDDGNKIVKHEEDDTMILNVCKNTSIPTLLLHGHQGLKNDLLRKRKEQELNMNRARKIKRDKDDCKNDVEMNSKDGKKTVIIIDDSDDEIETVKESIHSPPPPSSSSSLPKAIKSDKKRSKKRRIREIEMKQIAKRQGKKVFVEPNFDEPIGKRTISQKYTVNVAKSNQGETSTTIHNFQVKKSFTLVKESIEDKKFKDELNVFGPSVHVTQVLPRWLLPKVATSIENQKQTNHKHKYNDKVEEDEKVELKRGMGTYHPKFMILFEKSGSVVVVVSTANLTRPQGVDGTWLQRFHPVESSSCSSKNEKWTKGSCDGSDFGHVLCDFLQKQADAADKNSISPVEFLRQYLGISSLIEMQQKYSFDTASVHLVSTVPGSHPGRFGAKHLSKLSGVKGDRYNRRIFYGPQRISHITNRCTHCMNPWLPSKYISNSDKLIVQTTSFGSKWNKEHLQLLFEQYMGVDHGNRNSAHEGDLLQNIDIVWPTKRHMDEIKHEIELNCKKHNNEKISFDHFSFLSSEAFNSIDRASISTMTKYKSQHLSLLPHSLSPHIKSYARIICRENIVIADGEKETCLAWYMLTSACLSRGAQGRAERDSNIFKGSDENNYLNFELGVLFCSRLQGNPQTDRLYKSFCAQSSSCSQDSHNSIYLPIPFEMKSKSYQPFEDLQDFDDDPFFHEVTPKSIVEGNMKLTPLGKRLCKEDY